jgi:SAM-dependent methyltransferase
MSQITSGIRTILSLPIVYNTVQNIMGGKGIRDELVNDIIRPIKGMRILDIGCGTAEILAHLPDGTKYWGYDISPEYIASAKQRYGVRGTFHCGIFDRTELEKLPKFDVVLATGLLHHLDDSEAIELFALARAALVEGGRIITIDPCLAPGQNPIAKYLIERDRGQNVRDQAGYHSLARQTFASINGTLRHRIWIPYTHWIMVCT